MAYATTISFSRPLTGSTIIRLAEIAVRRCKPKYEKRCYVKATDPAFPDRVLVGQASDRGCDHVQIHPRTDDVHGLDPTASYRRVAVMSLVWPNWGHEISDNNAKLHSLAEFSDHLEALLNQ